MMTVLAPDAVGIRIREAVDADWEAAGRICYEAFASTADQHGFPHDFPSVEAAADPIRWLINHPEVFGVVAVKDGRVIGSNFLDERGMISAIGPISVDPGVQDHHVGRLLMDAVLARAHARRAPGVRLLQIAYHNRSLSLYAKLGMEVRGSFAALHGPAIREALPGYSVRPATIDDEYACNSLCLRVHGHARAGEVREAMDVGSARVVERLGRITGYTTGVSYFAHSVAETNDDLRALISEAEGFGTPGFLVPLSNNDLFRWCLDRGLRVFFVLNMMTLGLYQ
ncbi:MAG: GNAT family N-acetyltransferase, partial [Candidatus Limnocylindrales bacterium]